MTKQRLIKKEATKQRLINKEARLCRLAWEPYRTKWEGLLAWNLHPFVLLEPLADNPMWRIDYYLYYKDDSEQAVRLRNFRPFLGKMPRAQTRALAAWTRADAAWNKADGASKKADGASKKAVAAWKKVVAALADYANSVESRDQHLADVPNHTWNGMSIF